MRHPFSSFTLLLLFSERKTSLTEREFERHFDVVLEVLDKANNEKFRLKPDVNSEELESEETE